MELALVSAGLKASPVAVHSAVSRGFGNVKRTRSVAVGCESKNLLLQNRIRDESPSSLYRIRVCSPFSSGPYRFGCSGGSWLQPRLATGNGVPSVPASDAEAELTASGELKDWEKTVAQIGEALSVGFPLWVALACVLSLIWPNATRWINQPVQVWGITIIMLGMGMSLTPKDFQGALSMPKELIAGVILQYTVMPSLGYFLSRALQLPSHFAAGLILVACCPGGTASNIVTYLARGNVALSVLMTAASTFLAVVMTPVLTAKLVGQSVAVDASSLFTSTLQVVLLPVIGGAVANHFFANASKKISLFSSPLAVFIVATVCAGAVGRNAAAILASGGQIFVAVGLLHGLGFGLGYLLSRCLGLHESSCRTISIEVGMQNSVLGVVLAGQHFSNPLTAVPCAVSSVCHSVFGSALAGFWRLNPTGVSDDDKDNSILKTA